MGMNFQEGELIYLNKPYGMSSFGALARVRYLISKKVGVKRIKTGHAGTLDPLATGVLVLCTGRKTKEIETLQAHTKEYRAVLKLGSTTPSFDREHTVDFTYPTAHVTRELILDTLNGMKGKIMQVPPVYSACKLNGARAYKLARGGKEVGLQAKPRRVDGIELIDFNPLEMTMEIRVVCGKGTYIRSLARDIGEAMDTGAHLISLCRTRVGDVKIEDCVTLENFPQWLDENY